MFPSFHPVSKSRQTENEQKVQQAMLLVPTLFIFFCIRVNPTRRADKLEVQQCKHWMHLKRILERTGIEKSFG